MLPAIHLGPMALPTYPLLALLGFYFGLWLAAKVAVRRELDPDHIYNLGFYAVVAAAIGGRLGHVLRFFPAYRADPLSILSPNLAAFQPLFALAAALLVFIWYQRKYRLPLAHLIDALTYGALLTLAILALADGLNGKHFGTATTLPWAITQWSVARHPVQYYEMAGALLLVGGLWPRIRQLQPGQLTLVSLAGYAALRLFVDAFRDQPALVGDGFRLNQVVAFIAVLVLLLALYQTEANREGAQSVDFSWKQEERDK